MLPLMSKEKALALTSKADYSCPLKLMEAYRTVSRENHHSKGSDNFTSNCSGGNINSSANLAAQQSSGGLAAYGFDTSGVAAATGTAAAATAAASKGGARGKKRSKAADPELPARLLVQSEFGELRNGSKRKEPKLAKHVYNMCTSKDPELRLSSVS